MTDKKISSARFVFVTMFFVTAVFFATTSVLAQTANNDEGLAIVKQNDCFQCHRIPTKLIGPAYKDVAAKYKGADDAQVETLAKKVIVGGSGNWGATAMRAHPSLSLDDAKKAVRWVLSLSENSAVAVTEPVPPTGTAAVSAPVQTPNPVAVQNTPSPQQTAAPQIVLQPQSSPTNPVPTSSASLPPRDLIALLGVLAASGILIFRRRKK